ncbi:MAG TPA: cysteine--1-D-myo-inosityl 2-amino-2-deoxy-alpha-D-glucopyranoside ligase, partial [Streptosporangiaceae bacterium]|nr:cysteine--1-D-myo-inosityl 2-amino-2-deoxy-alpha-D-glucopyranoside ligase [Streptosporangiaceae bacterium]
RLALLAHHYRSDGDWTGEGLVVAARRLDRWRAAVRAAGASAPSAPFPDGVREVLTGVRERLADDLDAPGALAWVDRWADGVLADGTGRAAAAGSGDAIRDVVDALLGVAL